MNTDFSITGQISNDGNLLISNKATMQDALNHNKGCVIVGNFHIYKKGASEALRGYYLHKVVPDFQQAFLESGERLSQQQTEKRLRELSPICYEETVNEKTGKYSREVRELFDLSNQELCYLIEHLKEIAAEEFSFYIGDPNEY